MPLDTNEAVAAWLARVSAEEPPPTGVVAWYVGIFEGEAGRYIAHLLGSTRDADDEDWACAREDSFVPSERYLPLEAHAAGADGWRETLAAVERGVRAFVATAAGQAFWRGARAIGVGFDDGEMIRVR